MHLGIIKHCTLDSHHLKKSQNKHLSLLRVASVLVHVLFREPSCQKLYRELFTSWSRIGLKDQIAGQGAESCSKTHWCPDPRLGPLDQGAK